MFTDVDADRSPLSMFEVFLSFCPPVAESNLECITAFNCTGGISGALCNSGAFACTTWCWATDEVCLLETLTTKGGDLKVPYYAKATSWLSSNPQTVSQPISEEKVPFGGGGLSLVSLLSLSVVWRHSLGALCDITKVSQAQLCWFLLQVGSGVASRGQLLAPPSVFWKVLIQLDKDFFTVNSQLLYFLRLGEEVHAVMQPKAPEGGRNVKAELLLWDRNWILQ